ncbi:MAG: DMT family transporter [Clostridium sp.]|uniref:DMT family transporter n=1 Tax=Clostridium sp. TaxID=1506 RepID=UPI003053C5A9
MNKTKFYTNRINIVLLATLCCALWGSAYPAIKGGYLLFGIGTNDIPSKLVFAGYRFMLAGILVLIFQVYLKKNIFNFSKGEVGQVALLGITQTTLQYIFFYVGLSYTTGVSGAIINGTGTFFSIIIAHFIYKNDRLNFNKILGCILGFLGVVIANLNGGSLLESSFTIQGEGLVMLSAFMLSASSIYGKKITQNKDAATVTGYQLLIGGMILTVLGLGFGGQLRGFTLKSTSLLIYMSLLSSVAFVVWSELFKYNKVGTIAMFSFLTPIFGAVLSAIFLGENIFDIKIFIALVLVCLGIFWVYRVEKSDSKEINME